MLRLGYLRDGCHKSPAIGLSKYLPRLRREAAQRSAVLEAGGKKEAAAVCSLPVQSVLSLTVTVRGNDEHETQSRMKTTRLMMCRRGGAGAMRLTVPCRMMTVHEDDEEKEH